MRRTLLSLAIIALFFSRLPTANAVVIFGNTFDDTSFGDNATRIQGDVLFFGFTDAGIPLTGNFDTDLDVALTGSNLFTMIEGDTSAQNPYVVEIEFLDNYLFNGSSSDLAIFERGLPESFGVSIFDSRINDFTSVIDFLPIKIGDLIGSVEVSSGVNRAEINLSLWNLPSDLQINKIRIHGREADIAAVGGFNSTPVTTHAVPEPSTFLLLGIGILGVFLKRITA